MNFDKSFIMGEAGTNHVHDDPNQRFSIATDYVLAAFDSGVDAIKFQIFDTPNPETMFCWIDGDEERSERWHKSRLSLNDWKKVKETCDDLGIIFLASVFEYETVKWLSELNVEATKVASRAAAYFATRMACVSSLNEFKDAPKPLLVSNGMYEVVEADDVVILECEANYPSTTRWKNNFPGFSDHSGNPWRAIDAMARGCKLIEVHFYIDEKDAGLDLPASLTLDELKLVCEARDGINAL